MGIIFLRLKFWLDFKLICREKREYQRKHPFSIEKQDALSEELPYLIFEALASANYASSQNLLIPLTNGCITVSCLHETIFEKYPDFYRKHLNEFKVIENLALALSAESTSICSLESYRFKEPLVNHPKVNKIHEYCMDLYDRYANLYDGSFNQDYLEIMNEDQKKYCGGEFKKLREGILLRSA